MLVGVYLLWSEGCAGFWAHILCLLPLLRLGITWAKPLISLSSLCFPFLWPWAFWLLILQYHFIVPAIVLSLLSFLVTPWACKLMFLPCQRTSSSIFYSGFPWLTFYIFTPIGLCWSTFLLYQPISLLHSSGFLGPFTSSLPLLVNGLFARFFGLPQPNYHIFTSYYSSSLLAFKPIHWVY